MEANGKAKLLRIFISSTDKFRHTPLYEVIVYAAKRYGLAGATVMKGVMGFGASSQRISTVKLWDVTEKLPMVVEIIDEARKVEIFFETIKPYFGKLRYGCLITMEDAHVVLYKAGTTTLAS
jgi:uncharacterized protein